MKQHRGQKKRKTAPAAAENESGDAKRKLVLPLDRMDHDKLIPPSDRVDFDKLFRSPETTTLVLERLSRSIHRPPWLSLSSRWEGKLQYWEPKDSAWETMADVYKSEFENEAQLSDFYIVCGRLFPVLEEYLYNPCPYARTVFTECGYTDKERKTSALQEFVNIAKKNRQKDKQEFKAWQTAFLQEMDAKIENREWDVLKLSEFLLSVLAAEARHGRKGDSGTEELMKARLANMKVYMEKGWGKGTEGMKTAISQAVIRVMHLGFKARDELYDLFPKNSTQE